jgi:phosphocarrier protein
VATDGESEMLVREVTILNQFGIHARPAAMFVKAASRYDAEVFVERSGNRVSGKSIMGLMTLEASKGTRLRLMAQGADADAMLAELVALVENKFGEA